MSDWKTLTSPILGQAPVHHQARLLPRPATPGQGSAVVPIEGRLASPAELHEQGWRAGEAVGRQEGRKLGFEEGRRLGLEEGRAEGLRRGLEEAQEKLDAEIEAVKAAGREREAQWLQLLHAIPEQVQHRLEAMEDDMVALAHAALLRILGQVFESGQVTRLVVRQQLDELARHRELTVRVHPADAQLFTDDVQLAQLSNDGITLEADTRVTLGGCIVDTREGSLDARLETQLQIFTELLLRTRKQSPLGREESP